ncbi:MAG: UDP-N-acetylmuramoyl-L-alanine--D-glutamate ligase [Proteobacteria bacterium]|nr:UDP-N-acetylmuramoyl-L-alanine--D-glutamate ligase [Pseudomonadota bacterium]
MLGLGITGRSAARFLCEQGARVTVADERTETEIGPAVVAELAAELGSRVPVITGRPFPDPADYDLVVPSPGIPYARYGTRARRAWGDIELAGRALRIPIAAVTGTNGKSTTVRILETLLRAAGLRARAAGNIGTPALSLVGQPLDVAVLEVSSFQLESVESFRPRVAVILNLTPDHLDRHGNFSRYAETKRRLLAQQQSDDSAVLNFDDPVVAGMAATAKARVVTFSATGSPEADVTLDGGSVYLRRENLRLPLDDLRLPGIHNVENVLASVAAAVELGADPRRCAAGLAGFTGLPHRCEEVATLGGVTYVNDSKATNPGAARRSLESFRAPVVWIAGGRNKDLGFAELVDAAAAQVRTAFLIGEAAPALEAALAGRVATERAPNLEEAVRRAARVAEPGDVVLLSPASASFDQFSGFEERGERFRQAVAALADGETR